MASDPIPGINEVNAECIRRIIMKGRSEIFIKQQIPLNMYFRRR